MRPLYWISLLILFMGGINWALVGVLGVDLVAATFGNMTPLSRLIYSMVGVSAIIVMVSTCGMKNCVNGTANRQV